MKYDLFEQISRLSTIQRETISEIIQRFSEPVTGTHYQKSFLNENAYERFATRLSAHHAYSSSKLKKENFEHALAEIFQREGKAVTPIESSTHRGADLIIDGERLSLKTEASQGIKRDAITISKLMEAAWIKQIRSPHDIPPYINEKIIPHFDEYDRVFILRAFTEYDNAIGEVTAYYLNEIPLPILKEIASLKATDFTQLTKTNTTRAKVTINGNTAYTLRLDGSDDKLTIASLQAELCPMHASWKLRKPG